MKAYFQRHVKASLFLLIILVQAAVTPGTVSAEGDIPEAPPLEPILEPAPEPLVDAASAVETLAESGAVIVEESGEFVPLASQKALVGLSDPDPWYFCSNCAGGKATYVGVNSLSTALADWAAKKGYGFIYLEGGYLHNTTLIISGTNPGMSTLKGLVWDKTTPGAKPRLNAPTTITNFTNGFTMQGISMTASSSQQVLHLNGNKGTIRLTDVDVTNLTTGSGIIVVGQGSIFLNSVQAVDSNGYGAYLNNTYYDATLGKFINTGNITVTNSAFLRNGGSADSQNYAGLYPVSAGNIMLNGVIANGNYGNGAMFFALGSSIVIRNSTFSNNTAVPDNSLFGHGIYFSPGATANITLDNVTLNNNENSGAILSTTGNVVIKKVNAGYNGRHGIRISSHPTSEMLGARNVTVQDSNFYRNFVTGLVMFTSGAVRVSNVSSAYTSSGSGLLIDNTYAVTPVPVTVMGAALNNNYTIGLLVRSKGNITVAGIIALNNGFTSQLRNSYSSATGSVIISGSLGLNRFNGTSEGSGLIITTLRNVNVSSLQANGNPESGLFILAEGPASNITLTNVEISENTGLNSSPGLSITATGNVVLDRLTVSGNGREGIVIDNSIALTPRLVRISNTASNDNNWEGIKVTSVGAISLINVTASSNSLSGAFLSNRTTTLLPQGVTVQKSTFDGNGYRGLLVESQRQVTLVSVNASYNASNGIRINNNFEGSTSPIVISGTNRFIGNGMVAASNGVSLVTNGALTLSGITVSWSSFNGIGATSGALQNTLRNIVVQGNNQNGIHLITSGKTLLNGITSFQNSQDGVRISASSAIVSITGSTILGNGTIGLSLDVTTPATDVYIAPSTVIFGNTGGDYLVY